MPAPAASPGPASPASPDLLAREPAEDRVLQSRQRQKLLIPALPQAVVALPRETRQMRAQLRKRQPLSGLAKKLPMPPHVPAEASSAESTYAKLSA